MTIEFLMTSLVVVLIPGTGVLYTLAIGVQRGFWMSLAAAAGCTLGIVPAALASVVGLSAILHTSALAFLVVKYIGVAYLFFMAWSMLKEHGAMQLETTPRAEDAVRTAVRGTLLNVLNPKLSLFFLAFLPQFVPGDATAPTAQLFLLAGTFMAMTLVVFAIYGALAAQARQYVLARPRVIVWLRRAFAASFGLLGAKLAVSD